MKYLARCKKTLYLDWSSNTFGGSRKILAKTVKCEDLFNSLITLVSKKDQIAIIEDTEDNKLKLNILAGKSFDITLPTAQQYFDLIYLDDTCFETKQKVINKLHEHNV